MKADDIRLANELCQKKCMKTKSVSEHEAGLASLNASMLTEIAAQLAEANEYLKMYSNPPMIFEGTNINPADFSDLSQPITFTPIGPRATLRDQFAMAAITGNWNDQKEETNAEYAAWAYKLADAMIEARK